MNPDTAYQNAVKRRHEILQELEEIDQFLELYRRFAKIGEPLPEGPPPRKRERNALLAQGLQHRPHDRPSISQERFAKEARAILLEHGRPMQRPKLLAAFKARGLEIGGVDESKNLGTKIWRARDKFINIAGEGYWPSDVSCPAVDYDVDKHIAVDRAASQEGSR